jgi:dTDP-glucose 4,6-dehydratase
MRKLLVTGGAGFIGGNFVHYWMREHSDDRLVVLDALTYAGNLATIAGAEARGTMRFVHGDITDAALVARVLADETIDTIIHFAAESHVDRSIVEPGTFVKTNVVGTQVLLDAARAAWRSADGTWRTGVRFHHVSTDEVYGSLSPSDPPFTEQTPYTPSSPYAASRHPTTS